VSIIRGVPVPVVDAARLINEEATEPRRFVVVQAGDRDVALAVNEVLGVRAMSAGSMVGLPPLLRDATVDVVTAIGTLDAHLLLVLESMSILPQSVRETFGAVA
jgi:purine-binding chemotaxis protein CheW